MAAAQSYFDKWDSHRENTLLYGEAFVDHQLQPLYVILSCVADTLSPDSSLSQEEVQAVSCRAKTALSTFQQNLCELNGARLLRAFLRSEGTSEHPSTGTTAQIELQSRLTFEVGLRFINWHRSKLEDNVVKPLLGFCWDPRSADVVSDEVVTTLQESWSAAKAVVHSHCSHLLPKQQDVQSCPALVESHDGRYFAFEDRRSIKEFEAKLARLRRMVRHRNVRSEGQVSITS